MAFDKAKWQKQDGKGYPFRDRMLEDIIYSDSIRSLNQEELVEMLGEPDRSNENHLYYMIAQKRIASWPLFTKTMVIKFSDKDSIEWIKIHE